MNIVVRDIEPDAYFDNDEIQVTVLDHPMAKKRFENAPVGWTVAQIETAHAGGRTCSITADGRRVPPDERAKVIPAQSVQIVCVPGKGLGAIFRQIAGLAVSLLAAVFAPILAGPLIGALGLGVKAGALLTGAITTGISVVGSLVLNALFPASQPQLSSDAETSPTYSIGGGRNRANPFGPIPSLLGVHRVAPPYAASSYTEIIGEDQFLTINCCWGYGPLKIENLRIGETSIDEFDDVTVETLSGYDSDPEPALYPNRVIEDVLNIELEPQSGGIRTTAPITDRIVVDIQAPGGVSVVDNKGRFINYSVSAKVEIRPEGALETDPWTQILSVTIRSKQANAVRKTYSIDVVRGQYDVRVTRTSDYHKDENRPSETIYWTALRSFTNGSPINSPVPLALTTLRIRATSQLSGVVDTLNGDVSALVKSWNGAAWVDDQVSSNPADLFRHVLQGTANKKAVADGTIDLATVQDWHDYCEAQGFEFNQYRDFRASVWSTLRDICAAGRATPTFIDGKWSVIWDDAEAPIVQVFTPANSSGFKGSRGYSDKIQAFRVRFVDEDNAYQQDERLVFADGYDKDNTTRYEQIEFPGVTNRGLIWRHGRYHIAQLQLRREVYEITTDFEHLACVRGDRVLLTHDVPKIGLGFGRVKAVDGETVTLDNKQIIDVGPTYVLRFRLANGSVSLRTIATEGPVETNVVDLVADAGETAPAPGDLFAFGTLNTESTMCRVRAIRPAANLAATLELLDDAADIHNADIGSIPAFEPNISEPVDIFQYPPRNIAGREYLEVFEGALFAGVDLSWEKPPAHGPAGYYYRFKQDADEEWSDIFEVANAAASVRNLSAGTYTFQVKAIFVEGVSRWSSPFTMDVTGPFRVPQDVTNFRAVVSGANITLSWDAINDIIVADYEIRHTTDEVNPTWSSATALKVGYPSNTLTIPHLKGSFLIKARSYRDIYSENAVIITSNVTPLIDYNIVEMVSDTAFEGTHVDTVYNDTYSGLILNSSADFFDPADFFDIGDYFQGSPRFLDGVYTLGETIDLSGVMTSRLSAETVANGVVYDADFFTKSDFFDADDFFGVDASTWSVVTQIRTTDDDPNSSPVWGEWDDLIVGEYTARAYQFRLLLASIATDITPVVSSVKFTIDVPDRIISLEDITSGAAPYQIVFDPPYHVLKEVQITAQNMATGDYYTVSGKTAAGLSVAFFDQTDTAISRVFDARALGYGRKT